VKDRILDYMGNLTPQEKRRRPLIEAELGALPDVQTVLVTVEPRRSLEESLRHSVDMV